MPELKFPEKYIIRESKYPHWTCLACHRAKGKQSRVDHQSNVKWFGKRWKAKFLSYHLNVSRSHPPDRIIMACRNQWCIQPGHMYTGTADPESIMRFFEKFRALPPKISRTDTSRKS